jgi:hypothetical protein
MEQFNMAQAHVGSFYPFPPQHQSPVHQMRRRRASACAGISGTGTEDAVPAAACRASRNRARADERVRARIMGRVVPVHVEDAMAIVEAISQRARGLDPGSFALVMATGIVSVDLRQHGMPWLAQALFWLNLCVYAWLLMLTALRLMRHHQ